jgi:hypothetical protein
MDRRFGAGLGLPKPGKNRRSRPIRKARRFAMREWILLTMAALLGLAACTPHPAPPPQTGPAPASTAAQAEVTPAPTDDLLLGDPPPVGAAREFKTDFSKHSVPYSEILSGGPPKDGIPSIDRPVFTSIREADWWLEPLEPVILVQVGDEARAYPIQILMWHEIVNDTFGGLPLTVTFCPLCNTAIVFERQLGDLLLDFGTTGRLRFSNLIMYDRQTETWWQQATGEAIAGELTGAQLAFYPAAIVAWEEFKTAFPEGRVLSRQTGFARDYGRNPYVGYDNVNSPPFLYRGPRISDRLLPMERVLTIDLNGEAVAYPYLVLEQVGAVNDMVGGEAVLVLWQAGTASPLDTGSTASGRDVGSAAAFYRRLGERVLTFEPAGAGIRDRETGSTWDLFGKAVAGPLAGEQLQPVVAINHFWFSWAAFRPDTRVYQP